MSAMAAPHPGLSGWSRCRDQAGPDACWHRRRAFKLDGARRGPAVVLALGPLLVGLMSRRRRLLYSMPQQPLSCLVCLVRLC